MFLFILLYFILLYLIFSLSYSYISRIFRVIFKMLIVIVSPCILKASTVSLLYLVSLLCSISVIINGETLHAYKKRFRVGERTRSYRARRYIFSEGTYRTRSFIHRALIESGILYFLRHFRRGVISEIYTIGGLFARERERGSPRENPVPRSNRPR